MPTEVLTEDEIDELLTAISCNEEDECKGNLSPKIKAKRIKIYDINRPDILKGKDLLRLHSLLIDGVKKDLNPRILRFLKNISSNYVNLNSYICSLDSMLFEDFINSIPKDSTIIEFKRFNEESIYVELDSGICQTKKAKKLCILSYKRIINKCLKLFNYYKCEDISYLKDPYIPWIYGVSITIETSLNEKNSFINIFIPMSIIKNKFISKPKGKETKVVSKNNKYDEKEIKLNISAVLGETKLSLEEIRNLGEGSVIEFNEEAGSALSILVDGKEFAKGEIVVINNKYGIRVTEVVN